MRLFISCLLFSLIQHSSAQCRNAQYYYQLNLAKYHSFKGEYKKALKIYKYTEATGGFHNLDYRIASVYYNLGKNEKGLFHLEEYLRKGGDIKLVMRNRKKIFNNRITKQDSSFLVLKKYEYQSMYFSKIDVSLYNLVQRWYHTDQYFSIWQNDLLGNKKEQHKIRQKIFQNNLTELREFIVKDNKGLIPQFSQLGYYLKPLSLMFIHHTRKDSIDEVNHKFFKHLLKEEVCTRFTYSPVSYVQLIDNMQRVWEEGEPQVYGHYINHKIKQIYPLKFPGKVDSLRAEIGLLPLKIYAEMKNVKLPENYNNSNDSHSIKCN